MNYPTTHVTIHTVGKTIYFALNGEELFVSEDPLNWAAAEYCDYGQAEFPGTIQAVEALLLALRAERTELGDTGYTCDTLAFSTNQHAALEAWVRETRPEPDGGQYVIPERYHPKTPLLKRPLRVVVYHDLYITRGS